MFNKRKLAIKDLRIKSLANENNRLKKALKQCYNKELFFIKRENKLQEIEMMFKNGEVDLKDLDIIVNER